MDPDSLQTPFVHEHAQFAKDGPCVRMELGLFSKPYLAFGFFYEYREQYGLNKGVHRCPADRTAFGGSYDKQGWSWQQPPSQPIYDDSDFYSSYYPNSVILLGERPLSQVAAPDLTFLLLETSIPNATWRPNNGPDYFASIHGRGRNYHLGENNCYKGISAFVYGHAELWDWQRCAYLWDADPLELSPYFYGGHPVAGVPPPWLNNIPPQNLIR